MINSISNAAIAFPAEPTLGWTAQKSGNNGTLIAVILDESGSMQSCRDETISGFNEFVNGQKTAASVAGQAYLTLVKFDSPKVSVVFENTPINDVQPLSKETYTPNGMTNLYDSIGITMNRVNSILSSVPEDERPAVMIFIITDGMENSSREFNSNQIKSMVKNAEKSEWLFSFLGANIDSFSVGSSFGMNSSNTVSYSTSSMVDTMGVLSKTATNLRMAKMSGASTQSLYESSALYSAEDRKKVMGE